MSHNPEMPARQVAVVVNPTKFDDLEQVRSEISGTLQTHGATLLWVETTKDDPGTSQAKQMLQEGADMVCALGGDGTVRAVAAALVGTDVPLGLLPGGTGNLLARNLGLPIDSIPGALEVALSGADRAIDVGVVDVVNPDDTQEKVKDYIFLVMAGLGMDADVMADAPVALKGRVGWLAYVMSGVKNLNGERFTIRFSIEGGATRRRRVRSILLANAGAIQGGIEVAQDAALDDGTLNGVLISPKGLVGWGATLLRLVTRSRKGHHRVENLTFSQADIHLDLPGQRLQLDGDPIGRASRVTVKVSRHALHVRVPQ